MSQAELIRRTGITATVIDNIRTSPARSDAKRQRNVLTLAEAAGIPREEALQLAGLATPPAETTISVREAIHRSPYNDVERRALLSLVDVLDASRRPPDGDRSADRGNRSA